MQYLAGPEFEARARAMDAADSSLAWQHFLRHLFFFKSKRHAHYPQDTRSARTVGAAWDSF